MLSKEATNEFRKIYRKVFGEELTYKDAYLKASQLLDLYKIVHSPSFKSAKRDLIKKERRL